MLVFAQNQCNRKLALWMAVMFYLQQGIIWFVCVSRSIHKKGGNMSDFPSIEFSIFSLGYRMMKVCIGYRQRIRWQGSRSFSLACAQACFACGFKVATWHQWNVRKWAFKGRSEGSLLAYSTSFLWIWIVYLVQGLAAVKTTAFCRSWRTTSSHFPSAESRRIRGRELIRLQISGPGGGVSLSTPSTTSGFWLCCQVWANFHEQYLVQIFHIATLGKSTNASKTRWLVYFLFICYLILKHQICGRAPLMVPNCTRTPGVEILLEWTWPPFFCLLG